MFRVQKQPFSMDYFQMFIWGSTVHFGEPVAKNCRYLYNQARICEFWSFHTKTKWEQQLQSLVVPIFWVSTGESKSFGTQKTEKTPRHLVRIVFWSDMGPNVPKMPIFGQKKLNGPNMAINRPKFLILWE